MNSPTANRPIATILIPCPWCDATIELDDTLDGPVVRCATCATAIDLEPTTRAEYRTATAAA